MTYEEIMHERVTSCPRAFQVKGKGAGRGLQDFVAFHGHVVEDSKKGYGKRGSLVVLPGVGVEDYDTGGPAKTSLPTDEAPEPYFPPPQYPLSKVPLQRRSYRSDGDALVDYVRDAYRAVAPETVIDLIFAGVKLYVKDLETADGEEPVSFG